MAGAYWDSIFPGQSSQVRKALYGSVYIQDYSSSNNFANYSPFDPSTGLLSSTLLTTDGWTDLGYLDENGVEFTPQYSTADTNTWQSRQPLRTDVTNDVEQAKLMLLQSGPVADCLYWGLPLSSASSMGVTGYNVVKPKVPQMVYRSLMFLGVDGATGGTGSQGIQFMAKIYPRALMIKPDKQDWQAKTEIQTPLTFQAYPDTVAGYTIKLLREGPGWRALGVPGGVGALTITPASGQLGISWTAATVPSGAPALTSYTVTVTKVSDGSSASGSPFTVAAGTTTKTVTGLTSGQPYNVSVVAVNSNGNGAASTGVGTPT
ncbi:fibronectin type III domain-containing protein [Kutzneria albida]|uniref:Fibronectin type-III domain-containing protein n=1 Tax=Kutzneria albida DSM 43870 TaxID=1449976 RepID=W5WBR6_9PSEU|nr:fibronectin type III domain-containing protein [Kutzneria albida]AHH98332.1 hypothetical protein KALB_4970 [Kutzneria albida DSM 43870]